MKSRSRPPARASGRRLPLGLKAATPEKGGARRRNTHRRSPEIIEAAARVFAERGYHGATTQAIADVLNIRQASLYYYFRSKEVALEIVCTRGVEDFFKAAQAIAYGPGSPSEKLASLIRAHILPILDRGDFVKVFLTQRQFLPNESRRRVGKWSRGIENIFETVIREGQRSGEFRNHLDARLVALAILGMANAVSSWYGKEKASIERIGSEFAALVLEGLMVREGRSRRRG
jgi:AcrR family transcriptional regulator